jgi:hypothetical protein
VTAGAAAAKGTPADVNEQASLAHDLRGCEETLEHINSCLDKESERSVCISSIFKRHGHERIILNGLTVSSWDNSVCVVMGYRLSSQGLTHDRRKIFLFSTESRVAL